MLPSSGLLPWSRFFDTRRLQLTVDSMEFSDFVARKGWGAGAGAVATEKGDLPSIDLVLRLRRRDGLTIEQMNNRTHMALPHVIFEPEADCASVASLGVEENYYTSTFERLNALNDDDGAGYKQQEGEPGWKYFEKSSYGILHSKRLICAQTNSRLAASAPVFEVSLYLISFPCRLLAHIHRHHG